MLNSIIKLENYQSNGSIMCLFSQFKDIFPYSHKKSFGVSQVLTQVILDVEGEFCETITYKKEGTTQYNNVPLKTVFRFENIVSREYEVWSKKKKQLLFDHRVNYLGIKRKVIDGQTIEMRHNEAKYSTRLTFKSVENPDGTSLTYTKEGEVESLYFYKFKALFGVIRFINRRLDKMYHLMDNNEAMIYSRVGRNNLFKLSPGATIKLGSMVLFILLSLLSFYLHFYLALKIYGIVFMAVMVCVYNDAKYPDKGVVWRIVTFFTVALTGFIIGAL